MNSAGIVPERWRRYDMPAGTTVMHWIADFADRAKQLQVIVNAAADANNTTALKVRESC